MGDHSDRVLRTYLYLWFSLLTFLISTYNTQGNVWFFKIGMAQNVHFPQPGQQCTTSCTNTSHSEQKS